MSSSPVQGERLRFLLESVALEAEHLRGTDARLFAQPFTADRAASLRADVELAERVDAFAARFARLQDTAGDRLLPELLRCLAEPVGSVLDNLDRAEKLGLLVSTTAWVEARSLRNRMVHEYVRNPVALAEALNEAHLKLPLLTAFVAACQTYAEHRKLA